MRFCSCNRYVFYGRRFTRLLVCFVAECVYVCSNIVFTVESSDVQNTPKKYFENTK